MNTFDEFELISAIKRALVEENHHTPTPIQVQTLPAALSGRDILGCAQTGTGKTAAFALPILNQLANQKQKAVPNRPMALVLAPTRELAIQIKDSFSAYGSQLRLRVALVYGGVSQVHQVRSMNRGSHIVIATPGRLLDLMNQGHIKLDRLEVFVLDEADRMLDMGFMPDLKRIIRHLPNRRQSLFFSATLPPNITELSNRLLNNPVNVNVTPKSTSVAKIDQRVLFVERSKKQKLLREVISSKNVERAIVFTRTKRTANTLAAKLVGGGFRATAIHGDKSQYARQQALTSFRNKRVQVLVATDVAARGIDICGVSHVVNFDLPHEPEAYVHRIGRTGRAGAAGIALSFCSADEHRELRAIERLIGKKVPIDEEHSGSETSLADLPREMPKGKPRRRKASKGTTVQRAQTRRSANADTKTGDRTHRKRKRRRNGPRTKSAKIGAATRVTNV